MTIIKLPDDSVAYVTKCQPMQKYMQVHKVARLAQGGHKTV